MGKKLVDKNVMNWSASIDGWISINENDHFLLHSQNDQW